VDGDSLRRRRCVGWAVSRLDRGGPKKKRQWAFRQRDLLRGYDVLINPWELGLPTEDGRRMREWRNKKGTGCCDRHNLFGETNTVDQILGFLTVRMVGRQRRRENVADEDGRCLGGPSM